MRLSPGRNRRDVSLTDEVGTGLKTARGLHLNLRTVSGRVVMSGAE